MGLGLIEVVGLAAGLGGEAGEELAVDLGLGELQSWDVDLEGKFHGVDAAGDGGELGLELADAVGGVGGDVEVELAFLLDEVVAVGGLAVGRDDFDGDDVGKLGEELRVEDLEGEADLVAQLVGGAEGLEGELALAELLGAGEVAELLDPVGVEDALAGVEAPPPGVVDGGEEGAAGAVAAEDEERGLAAVGGGGGGVLGVDLADAGLDLDALAEPEDGLDLVLDEVLVLRLVLEEAEDGGLLRRRG